MRTKHHLALFAFVVTFAFSAVIANFLKVENGALTLWNETKSAQKITELLRQDVANGQERILNEDYVITTLAYVNNSENLDDSNLPSDFQRAWRAHMNAWRDHSDFLLEGRRYRSNASLQRTLSRNTTEINRTWLRVLQTAKEHGAEIPAGAYDY